MVKTYVYTVYRIAKKKKLTLAEITFSWSTHDIMHNLGIPKVYHVRVHCTFRNFHYICFQLLNEFWVVYVFKFSLFGHSVFFWQLGMFLCVFMFTESYRIFIYDSLYASLYNSRYCLELFQFYKKLFFFWCTKSYKDGITMIVKLELIVM